MDLTLLLIRLAVGGVLAAHGAQKLFGWFGGHGLGGTARFLESLGFRPGRPYAWVLGGAELGGGVLLALGLLTPFAAAAVAGVMLAATVAVHWDKGFFAENGGFEFPLVLGVGAIAVAIAGAGAYSLDGALGWSIGGEAWGVLAAGLAVVASAAVLASRGARLPRWRRRPSTA
ncbi:MAG TPA: DoxX family protein [Acidimicrobiales bacterium]|jgi:putative oxidoreductase|nr:DoxX family protein [Acidimicrobiales bacterium]